MNKHIIALALFSVLVLSGCIEGSDDSYAEGAGPGVVITELRSDFSNIDAGEPITIMMSFENVGDYKATEVKGELIRKGAFKNIEPTYTGPITLERPLETTYSGDEFFWDMEAPVITQIRTEEVQGRLIYDYQTEAYATINFVPREMLREQGLEAFPLDSISSYGPIEIDIVASQPVTLRDGDAKSAIDANYREYQVRVNVLLDNVGSGRAETKDTTIGVDYCKISTKPYTDCLDSVTLEAYGGGCAFVKDASIVTAASFTKEEQGIRLIQGQEGRWSVPITFAIQDINAATSCQLKVTAKYTYRVDSKVLPITISPID
ncbi:MAG: hypothetical protein ABIG20_01955 [archaeon]